MSRYLAAIMGTSERYAFGLSIQFKPVGSFTPKHFPSAEPRLKFMIRAAFVVLYTYATAKAIIRKFLSVLTAVAKVEL